MYINWQLRELNLKIVYYGPSLSGKTTNLEQIYSHVDPHRRSELVSLKTHEDRTLFFDFLQLELGKVGSLTPKIQLYTVPGQAYYEASRKLVLKGADGVVFVVDSASERLWENIEAWMNMYAHLESLQVPVNRLPILVQFNKQDLPNALKPEKLKMAMDIQDLETTSAIASRGQGVFDTLKLITRQVITQVQREMA
ncbi:MAG: ADP-ribosylation factor-like protein [Anaerolineae bacterium]|nr:ADP-ribosylation factor-like protein [Anaerolineae bacterium]